MTDTALGFQVENFIAPVLNGTSFQGKSVTPIGCFAVTTSSQQFDLSTFFPNYTRGHMITFFADGADIGIAFTNANSGSVALATTGAGAATSCQKISSGTERSWFIPNDCKWVTVIGAAACTLRMHISSLNPTESVRDM